MADALRGVGDGRSGSELRRNFSQGGVTLNDPDAGVRLVLTDPRTPVRFTANGSAGGPRVVAGEGGVTVHPGAIVQIGKRLFIRCVAG